ncbi:MAG: FG-GAP repeat protein [Pyrinomonadaceae bacterium]
MRVQLLFGMLLLPLFFVSCSNNNTVSSQVEQTEDNSTQSNKSNAVTTAKTTTATKTSAGNLARPTEKTQKSTRELSTDELISALPGLLGNDFFLIKSYEPSHLIGDFNGDGYSDAVVVVGAQDRYGEPGELVNPVENLCYLSVDVSFQNIIKGSLVPARPKQNCREIEKKKSVLEPKESQYCLFVVFGDEQGLENVSRRSDAFGQKFLLLDAVYQNENIEKAAANAKDGFAVKIKSCVPSSVKSDLIGSVNSEGGTMAIYFDGKKFVWTQCGD